MEPALLELFLTSEKTVEEWTSIFAQIIAVGSRLTADSWARLEDLLKRARTAKKPKRTSEIKTELINKFVTLSRDLADLRGTIEGAADDPGDAIGIRLATLEAQIKYFGMAVEEWVKSQTLYMKEIQDNVEEINARIVDIEAHMGEMPLGLAGKFGTNIWDILSYLVKRPESTDPFTYTTWTKTHKDFLQLRSEVLSEKRNGSDFQQAVVKLCAQFKSDIQHLDRQLKATNSEISSKFSWQYPGPSTR